MAAKPTIEQGKRLSDGPTLVWSQVSALASEEIDRVVDEGFQRLIEIAPDCITINQDRQIIFANQAAADQLGASDPREILGRNGFDFVAPADRQRIAARVRDLYEEGGQSGLTRFQRIRLDGGVVDVEAVAIKILWDGRPAVLSLARDITARLRAEARLQGFLAIATDLLWETDAEHRFTYLSNLNKDDPASTVLFGKTRWEAAGVTPDCDEGWRAHVADLEAQRPFSDFEYRSAIAHWRGQYRSVSGIPVFDARGVFQGYRGTSRDITERKHAERALRESEQRFKLALEGARGGVFDIDLVSGTISYDDYAATMLGYQPNEVPCRLDDWIERIHPSDRAGARAGLQQHLEGKTEFLRCEHRQRTKSGSWLWCSCIGKVVERDDHGRPRRLVGIRCDITDRKEAERTIEHMARHDTLTKLPNRVQFERELERVCKAAQRDGAKIAVMFLDLDHFKDVNDTLGHSVGDKLLVEAAKRLKACIRAGDLIARFGGDEFVIVVDQPYDSVSIGQLANRITLAIDMPYDLDGHMVHIGISIGVAIYPDDGADTERILANADLALYAAKGAGRQTWRVFDHRLQEQLQAQHALHHQLRHALDQKQFELHYQPVINIADKQVRGFEALIRWNHPVRGRLLPDPFIPVAEESRLAIPLTEWVFEQAAIRLRQWASTRLSGCKIAVNVPPILLKIQGFVELIDRCFANTGSDPRKLVIEITEGTLIDETKAIPALTVLRQRGVTIAVDDFGMGYSSMVRLKTLPVDVLKIDRSFLSNTPHDASDASIVESLVNVGHSLGKKVVAEGVENLEQLRFLERVGCDSAQGFAISHPMAAADVPIWFERWQS